MNGDSFKEVTNVSWFSRIGNSIQGILLGVILVVGSIVLLFWNEGRAVKTAASLQEGAKSVISVSAQSVNSANEGKLVHLTGFAATEDIIEDAEFGISVNAIKLKRKVEMYQWKEDKETHQRNKVGGGTEKTTTYTYHEVWSENIIDSSDFKKRIDHENPGYMAYESKVFTAGKVNIEAFILSEGLIRKMNNYELLPVNASNHDKAAEDIKNKAKVSNGLYYIGINPYGHQIGDMRVSYEVVLPSTVSIVAQQSNNSFKPYITRVGRELEMLSIGSYSADEMFKKGESQNKILTWILRLVGFILMGVGFSMIFGVLSVIADVIPLLGNLISLGTGIISFMLAATISLIAIALGWVFYRPLTGIILFVIAAVPVTWLIKSMKKKTVIQK